MKRKRKMKRKEWHSMVEKGMEEKEKRAKEGAKKIEKGKDK